MWRTLKGPRAWVMWGAAALVLCWFFVTDPNRGSETLLRLQWLVWPCVASGLIYLLRRAFHPDASSGDAYRRAMESPVGAGLVFLGLCLLTGLLFLGFATRAAAAELPPGAVRYLPVLVAEQQAHWPDVPLPSALAAQVEQETCPSLRSPKCWNPRAELRTSREYGFGLGQLTVTPRFNNFVEARRLDASLRDWQFADRFDPARQLRTLVLMDRAAYVRLAALVPDERARLAMAFSAYNGGLGGVLNDRRLCAAAPGCDPGQWFGHVALHSTKARVATGGYGQGFFQINRGYVRAAMIERRPRYAQALGEEA